MEPVEANRQIGVLERRGRWHQAHASLRDGIHAAYARWLRPHLSHKIHQQRLKLIWHVWGYRSMLRIRQLSLLDKLRLIARFVSIDWNVVHGHTPLEIASICQHLADRPARRNEVIVEAGCWYGGSSAKLSIIGKLLGYKLHIYDSFEGVEPLTEEEKSKNWDFSGEYAAPETSLRQYLMQYGETSECFIHKGWFADTIAVQHVTDPVRAAYIDCDVAKGTYEVLLGVMPTLVDDGYIFSQDFHIRSVEELLRNPRTWDRFGRGTPSIARLSDWPPSVLVLMTFDRGATSVTTR